MKRYLSFLLLLGVMACKKKSEVTKLVKPSLPEYAFDTDANSKLMLQDGEDMLLMTAVERTYEIGKVLRVKAIDNRHIEIANFSPVNIENATILANIKGKSTSVKMMLIKNIRAHAVQVIEYPFLHGDTLYNDANNNIASIGAPYNKEGLAPSDVTFDFTGETPLIQQLLTLKQLDWKVRFKDFDGAGNAKDNWKDNPTAKDFRRFSGLIINLATLMVNPATKTSFVAEPITKNDGKTFLTEAEKVVAFDKLMKQPLFECGVVVNVSGLGGNATYGVAEHVLKDYLTKDVCEIAIHEMAHKIGYQHSSTMTYAQRGKGATIACSRVWNQMLTEKAFPVTPQNYAYPSDYQ